LQDIDRLLTTPPGEGLQVRAGKINGAQCDISTGAVIVRRILRVTGHPASAGPAFG
jgi:hypothetical protein